MLETSHLLTFVLPDLSLWCWGGDFSQSDPRGFPGLVPLPGGLPHRPHIAPVVPLRLGSDGSHRVASPSSIPYVWTLHVFKVQPTCFLQPEIFTDTVQQSILLPGHCQPCLRATRAPPVMCCSATPLLMWPYFAVCSSWIVLVRYRHVLCVGGWSEYSRWVNVFTQEIVRILTREVLHIWNYPVVPTFSDVFLTRSLWT